MRFEHEAAPVRVHERTALTSLVSSIVTAWPAASVVLTLWLSMIAAEGLASRPTGSRSAITSAWLSAQNAHRRARRRTSGKSSHGGKSFGSRRHGQPARIT